MGFGDAVTLEPQTVVFPVLLDDLTAPVGTNANLTLLPAFDSPTIGGSRLSPFNDSKGIAPAPGHRKSAASGNLTSASTVQGSTLQWLLTQFSTTRPA